MTKPVYAMTHISLHIYIAWSASLFFTVLTILINVIPITFHNSSQPDGTIRNTDFLISCIPDKVFRHFLPFWVFSFQTNSWTEHSLDENVLILALNWKNIHNQAEIQSLKEEYARKGIYRQLSLSQSPGYQTKYFETSVVWDSQSVTSFTFFMYLELQLARKQSRTVELWNATDSTLFIHSKIVCEQCLFFTPFPLEVYFWYTLINLESTVAQW